MKIAFPFFSKQINDFFSRLNTTPQTKSNVSAPLTNEDVAVQRISATIEESQHQQALTFALLNQVGSVVNDMAQIEKTIAEQGAQQNGTKPSLNLNNLSGLRAEDIERYNHMAEETVAFEILARHKQSQSGQLHTGSEPTIPSLNLNNRQDLESKPSSSAPDSSSKAPN